MPEKEHLCSLAVINSDLLGTELQICAPIGLQTLIVLQQLDTVLAAELETGCRLKKY